MSFRTDSGVCKYCGAVIQLAQLMRLKGDKAAQGAGSGEDASGQGAVDGYVCQDCGEDGEDGEADSSPGVA